MREGYKIYTYLTNVDLDGGMILSVEDSVSGRALSGDIEINELSLIVLVRSIWAIKAGK